jgi:hypothetical protein
VLRAKATEEVLSAELRSQLYVAFDIDYLDQQKFRELWIRAEEVGGNPGPLRASIRRQKQINLTKR